MTDTVRNEKGQFVGSGNPKGRPLKFKRDPKLPASRRRSIFNVADRPVQITIDGKIETVSMYEACLFRMAAAGAQGNRIAAKQFIELTMAASDIDLTRNLIAMKNQQYVQALEEENEKLQAKVAPKTGVVHVPWEEWDKVRDRRLDDGIHLEDPVTDDGPVRVEEDE